VSGVDPRVAEWRFVPDTDRILLLGFDASLILTSPDGGDATALGSALAIEGIARGSSKAIVDRGAGPVVIDLSDASETPLVAADIDLGLLGPVTPVPGGGTVRRGSATDAAGIPIGTTVAAVAENGAAALLLEPPQTDVVLQTCVSPSGRYAAVLVAPDAVANPYDRYQLPLPENLVTHVVEMPVRGGTTGAWGGTSRAGAEVVALSGLDISWCQVPPR
jgi:hypothetical protein